MDAKIRNVEDIDVFFDRDRDVLYISFGEVREADDSELTGNDVIVRYKKGEVVGVTVLEFSRRAMGKADGSEKAPAVA